MLQVGGDAEQPDQLVVVGELGQDRRRLGARQVEVRVGQAERDAVEKADAVAGAVAALPGQSPLVVQEDEVVLNFPGRDPVRAAAVMAGKPGNRVEVGLPGVLGETANGHVVDHALAKLCHGSSPSLGPIGHEDTPMLLLVNMAVDACRSAGRPGTEPCAGTSQRQAASTGREQGDRSQRP